MEYRLVIDGVEACRSGAIRPLLRYIDQYAKQFVIQSVLIENVSTEDTERWLDEKIIGREP